MPQEKIYTDLVTKVLNALESIRPFLNRDGGDIELVNVENNIVTVKLLGNCGQCSMSLSTMKFGVEHKIKEYAPEITEVISIA
ncbi:NifU family protein [Halpernia sp.]|uniref:NifU family protein n=1 Tax=Halpernia sp. TaxID=2782209 RepID=UPI003A951C37